MNTKRITDDTRLAVCKELIDWATQSEKTNKIGIKYMEEKVYAISIGTSGDNGIVTLIKANSPADAYERLFGFVPKELDKHEPT